MPQIRTRTLACGMPLIAEAIPGVRSVGLSWQLPAGSSGDPDGREGLCTMWSELVFRGAGGLDSRAQADAMDRLGLSRSCDLSTFHLRLSSSMLGDRLPAALEILVDMVRRPRMDEASIEPTRDLALQALESLKDDPTERAMIALKARHAPPPLNRSGLGTPDGLAGLSRDEIVQGWSERARPSGAILAIAGDIDAAGGIDALAAGLDRLLAGWSGAPPGVTPGTSATRGTYHHIDDKSAQVQVALMYEGPPEPHPDSKLERIASTVLSGGMAARLFTEVREKRGLCYSVSASYATDRDFGRSVAYVGTTPERAQESLDVLLAELHRINTHAGRISEDEFQRAMTGIKANLIFSGESTGARAAALAGDQHRLGRPRSLEEIAGEYAKITLDHVNGYLARRKLGPITIVTLGPAALTPP